ncbi:unnamed protein product [Gadus morhua 'NCC']
MLGIIVLLLLPYLARSCPVHCECYLDVAVRCVGPKITDVPGQMPSNMTLLQLNVTNINVLNKWSLQNMSLLLRFSLIQGPLHTIHPLAFYTTPQLRSIKLSLNKLVALPGKVFSPLADLEQLLLDANRLESIPSEMLRGLTRLQHLELSSNQISRLDPGVFDGLSSLTFLNLGGNLISALAPGTFRSLTALRRLMLYTNRLEVLGDDALFGHLPELVDLKIHNNHITRLAPKVFWSLGKLSSLTLSGNQLQEIPEKSFYHMPQLVKLTLWTNPLRSLPARLMGHTPFMQEFYLFSTALATVPGNLFANMTGLLRLNLHLNSQLQVLPAELFHDLPKLKKLSIRGNDLRTLHPDQFFNLASLSVLNLNDNKLRSLPSTIFQNLKVVSAIDLKKNDLQTLPGEIFHSNGVLAKLSLTDNRWHCDCQIEGLAYWLRANKQVLDDKAVMCQSPLYQMLRPLWSLGERDFYACIPLAVGYFPRQRGSQTKISTSRQSPALTTYQPSTSQSMTFPLASSTPASTAWPPRITTTASTTASTTAAATTATSISPEASSAPPSIPSISMEHHSRPFYDRLVLEQGPEFVHHHHHQGWVSVWTLPLDAAHLGLHMTSHILLMVTGALLIFASMCGMYRLEKVMRELWVEDKDGRRAL